MLSLFAGFGLALLLRHGLPEFYFAMGDLPLLLVLISAAVAAFFVIRGGELEGPIEWPLFLWSIGLFGFSVMLCA